MANEDVKLKIKADDEASKVFAQISANANRELKGLQAASGFADKLADALDKMAGSLSAGGKDMNAFATATKGLSAELRTLSGEISTNVAGLAGLVDVLFKFKAKGFGVSPLTLGISAAAAVAGAGGAAIANNIEENAKISMRGNRLGNLAALRADDAETRKRFVAAFGQRRLNALLNNPMLLAQVDQAADAAGSQFDKDNATFFGRIPMQWQFGPKPLGQPPAAVAAARAKAVADAAEATGLKALGDMMRQQMGGPKQGILGALGAGLGFLGSLNEQEKLRAPLNTLLRQAQAGPGLVGASAGDKAAAAFLERGHDLRATRGLRISETELQRQANIVRQSVNDEDRKLKILEAQQHAKERLLNIEQDTSRLLRDPKLSNQSVMFGLMMGGLGLDDVARSSIDFGKFRKKQTAGESANTANLLESRLLTRGPASSYNPSSAELQQKQLAEQQATKKAAEENTKATNQLKQEQVRALRELAALFSTGGI